MSGDAEDRLELDIRRQGMSALVAVTGSVGISEADDFQVALEGLTEEPWPLVVLDLGGMDFICSSGLGAIVSTHLRLRRHGGNIKLVSPCPSVRQVLETTQLNRLFGIYDSVEEAIASHDFKAD